MVASNDSKMTLNRKNSLVEDLSTDAETPKSSKKAGLGSSAVRSWKLFARSLSSSGKKLAERGVQAADEKSVEAKFARLAHNLRLQKIRSADPAVVPEKSVTQKFGALAKAALKRQEYQPAATRFAALAKKLVAHDALAQTVIAKKSFAELERLSGDQQEEDDLDACLCCADADETDMQVFGFVTRRFSRGVQVVTDLLTPEQEAAEKKRKIAAALTLGAGAAAVAGTIGAMAAAQGAASGCHAGCTGGFCNIGQTIQNACGCVASGLPCGCSGMIAGYMTQLRSMKNSVAPYVLALSAAAAGWMANDCARVGPSEVASPGYFAQWYAAAKAVCCTKRNARKSA